MKSPMSDKDTLDKVIYYCQLYGINVRDGSGFRYRNCVPRYNKNLVVQGRFVFDAHKHDTGCSVRCWIVNDKEEAYQIINATYWYYHRYTYNESEWKSGAWNKSLEEAINSLREAVDVHDKVRQKAISEYNEEKKKKDQERKVKFEALFTESSM